MTVRMCAKKTEDLINKVQDDNKRMLELLDDIEFLKYKLKNLRKNQKHILKYMFKFKDEKHSHKFYNINKSIKIFDDVLKKYQEEYDLLISGVKL